MELTTLKKKIKVLEHAFAASAGTYYSINLTQNLVPGAMYQVIDDKEYSINEEIGMPENASFSDVVAYWGNKLDADQQSAYFEFFDISRLIDCYHQGNSHVFLQYWTKTALFEPMLAEQHIVMYTNEENGDILAITYVLDLTEKYKKAQYTEQLRTSLEAAEKAKEYDRLQVALQAVNEILDNLSYLDSITTELEFNQVMPQILSAMGKYSMADRAYLFLFKPNESDVLHMTHEWCADGVRPTIGEMQHLRLCDMPNWTPILEAGNSIVSSDWSSAQKSTPEEYALFDGQDIKSLIVIPILSKGVFYGYIGFDNPEQSKSALSISMLKSAGGHIGGLRENLRMMSELEQKQQSLQNSFDELGKEAKILDALSIDYTTVYFCDLDEDTIIALKQGSDTNSALTENEITAGLQTYSFRIRYYFDNYVLHESAPDFLEKMDATYLKGYLESNKRFAYRFQTLPSPAGLSHFEVQIVRLEGLPGFKVVMGYRYIDDIIAEQTHQQNLLERALEDATLNSEIVDSISKIYWLIYRMDLLTGTYEEISAGQEMHRLTGKHGMTDEVFADARKTIVAEEHQEHMRVFLDTSTLPERLQDTDSVATEYRAASGSWHLARFIVKKRDEDGRVISVLYVVRQIDKQKQQEIEYQQKLLLAAEDAKKANIAKTDFLRRMSHDIRTPINGIRGIISIANHYPNDAEKQKDCRDKVMQASGFLLDLVNSVLDMNKLESGAVELSHEPFDLREVLLDTCNIIEMQGQEYAIPFNRQPWHIEHPYVLGSPLHLRQILQNVAGNAMKYNRVGGHITASCDEIESDDKRAVFLITCTDNGRGMSENFLKRAFEPFAQECDNARTAFTGTGLGLAITKQLIELMGGSIKIESKLGVGTKVSMTIPFDIDVDYKSHEAEDNDDQEISLTGIRVLLVEDNDLNMEIARFLLEKAGMVVTSAWNGQEALDKFLESNDNQYDVILMDVMMPVMDGLDATRAIRASVHPDAKTIPIFAMTANAFPEDIALSKAAGMNEHLSKPLQEGDVLRAIQRYVKKKSN